MTRRLLPLLLLMLSLMFAGCGSESDVTEDDQDAFEKALFVSYAGIKSGKAMNDLVVEDFEEVLDDVKDIMVAYIADLIGEGADVPDSVTLSTVRDSGVVTVPDSIDGMVRLTSTNPFTFAAELALTAYQTGGKAFSGNLNMSVTTNIIDLENVVTTVTYAAYAFEVPARLTVTSSNTYSPVTYDGYTLNMTDGPSQEDYTLNGTITAGGTPYVYHSMVYNRTGDTDLDVDGVIIVGGVEYDYEGEITTASATSTQDAEWEGGTLTIEAEDLVDVTIDTSTATLDDRHGTVWDYSSWNSIQLVP